MQDRIAFDNLADIGPVAVGPLPRLTQCVRWAQVEEVDLAALPPVKTWECLRTPEPIVVDGRLDEA